MCCCPPMSRPASGSWSRPPRPPCCYRGRRHRPSCRPRRRYRPTVLMPDDRGADRLNLSHGPSDHIPGPDPPQNEILPITTILTLTLILIQTLTLTLTLTLIFYSDPNPIPDPFLFNYLTILDSFASPPLCMRRKATSPAWRARTTIPWLCPTARCAGERAVLWHNYHCSPYSVTVQSHYIHIMMLASLE